MFGLGSEKPPHPCKQHQRNIYRPCSSVTSYWPVSAQALKKENVFLTSLLKIKLSYFTPVSLTIWKAESRWFALRGICAWCTALYHQATSIKSLSAWREMLQVRHCSQVLWDLTKSTCQEVLTNLEETVRVAQHAEGRPKISACLITAGSGK